MKKIIIPLLVALLAASCTTLYHPQLEAIPLIEEKGELNIETGLSHQDALSGNISIAYGLTDHIALQGFGRTNKDGDVRNLHGQLAAGLYGQTAGGLDRELYLGVAAGRNADEWGYENHPMVDIEGNPISFYDQEGNLVNEAWDRHAYTGDYHMLFLQGNIGQRNKHFEWAVGLKAGILHSYIRHTQSIYDYSDLENDWYYNYQNPYNEDARPYDNVSLLLQPQAELRFGWERFKFTYRIAYGIYFGLPSAVDNTFMGHFNSGFGIQYRF